jgi:hypothetical protein
MNTRQAAAWEVISQIFSADNPDFTAQAAGIILGLGFNSSDRERMNELAAKSRAGRLTEVETEELEAYLFVGSLIDLIHAKARGTINAHSDDC